MYIYFFKEKRTAQDTFKYIMINVYNKRLMIIGQLIKLNNYYKSKIKYQKIVKDLIYTYVDEKYKKIISNMNEFEVNNSKFLEKRYIYNKLKGIDTNEIKNKLIKNASFQNDTKLVKYINRKRNREVYLLIKECVLLSGKDNLRIEENKIISLIVPYKLEFYINIIKYNLANLNYKIKMEIVRYLKTNSITRKESINIDYKNLKIEKVKKPKEQLQFHLDNNYLNKIINRKKIFISDIYSYKNIPKHNMFHIESKNCISSAAKYLENNQEPIYRTALELIDYPNLNINDSFINKHYKTYKPNTFGELLNLKEENQFYDLPISYTFKPWAHKYPTHYYLGGIFGPKDQSLTEMRFYKIKNLINNIKERGYNPSYNDLISGYILKKGEEYRFIVLQGWHRLGVLQAFNKRNPVEFKFIPVKFDELRINLKIANYNNIKNWPAIKSKTIKIDDALEIANKFFIRFTNHN